MRFHPLALVVTLFTAGCAARLPVPNTPPSLAQSTAPASFMTQVSEERLSRMVVPISEYEATSRTLYEGGAEEEESLRNEIAIFLGYTSERGEGGFTIGLDYAYWINEQVGIGPFIDYVAGDLHAFALGAALSVRPFRRLKDLTLYVGPGLDIVQEEEHSEEHGGVERKWETNFLMRLGILYGWDLGKGYRFVPSFYWDAISMKSQAFVLGITFGKEF